MAQTMLSNLQKIAFFVILVLTIFQKSMAFADDVSCIENVLLSREVMTSNEFQIVSSTTDEYNFILNVISSQNVERDSLICDTQYDVFSVSYILGNIQSELFSQCGFYVDDYQYLTRGIIDFQQDDEDLKFCNKNYSSSLALFLKKNQDTSLTSKKLLIGQYLANTLNIEGFTISEYLSALSQTDESQYTFEAAINTFEAGRDCFKVDNDSLLESMNGNEENSKFLPFRIKIETFEFHNEILKGTPNNNHISPNRMCSIRLMVKLYP